LIILILAIMKRSFSYIIFIVFICFLFGSAAQAINLKDAFSVSLETPFGYTRAASGYQTGTTPEFVVARIINIFLSFLGIIFICLIVYGGYLWMTAMGKEQQVAKGKDLITEAVIGLVIVVAAYAITYFIVMNIVAPYERSLTS